MAELGAVLRLDLRRTMILFAVPVLAVLGVLTAWRALIPGVAYWDNTVVSVGASVRPMGPVTAALAVWTAIREHRLDHLRALSPRSPALGPLLDLFVLTVVAVLAYGVVAAVIVVNTLVHTRIWDPHPVGLLAGAAALTLHVVLGYLAGRLVPSPLTVAAVAAATWLWVTLRPAGASWLSLLPPAAIGPVGPFAGLRHGLAAAQLLWSLGLGTALILAYVWPLSRRAVLALPLAAALTLTALCTLRLHSYGNAPAGPAAPAGHACAEWPLTVCVHPALRGALPALETAVTPLAARLAGTPGAFRRVEQLPGEGPGALRGGVAWIHLADLAPGYGHRAAGQLAAALLTHGCPATAAGSAYGALVNAWLLDEPAPGSRPWPPPAAGAVAVAARRFTGWDEERRRRWLGAHYVRYRLCELGPGDFAAAAS